ncbi:MAG: efflux RND transporter periplasmic adaptor subunit [Chitinophagaceae bacterium]|nr:efflux RND transporter periplasmic adaptor subunit [Chitinophagaceae bacterium]
MLLFLLIGCKDKTATINPTEEKITEAVYASGVIKSVDQYQVYASANGVVTEVLVQEGDMVNKGDALMHLNNTTAQLNIDNAGLAANYAAAASNTEKLRDLQNAVQLAKVKMDNDASLLGRQRNLWKQDIGTRNEVERLELAYANSSNAHDAAKLKYAELQKQISFQDKQAQKNLSIIKSIAADYTVKSELDGKVYNLLVSKGEMVNMQSPVAVVGNAGHFTLELQVDEYDIARIKPGQRVLINMDSYKGEVFEATVSRINPLMNERSKSFTIEAVFVKQPPALFPNLTCEANIVIRSKDRALTMPRNFLMNGDYVLLENNEKRKVVTGLKDYQKVEIMEGLTSKDVIRKPE